MASTSRRASGICALFGVLLASAAMADAVFLECAGCSLLQMQQQAIDSGDGLRYVFDLATSEVHMYRVSHSKADEAGHATVVEISPVDSRGQGVIANLHKAWMADSNFARTTNRIAIPISDIGDDPGTDSPYVPKNVAWANGNFGAFTQHLTSYFSSDAFAQASPALQAFLIASSQAATISGPVAVATPSTAPIFGTGGNIVFQLKAALYQVRLTDAQGNYVLVNVYADGQFAYAGAFDVHGSQYQDHVITPR